MSLEIVAFLQASITPVALISGVGIIILTLTNRLARIVDKIRSLCKELDETNIKRRDDKIIQTEILFKRAKIIRTSITLITCSIISSGLIILVLALNLFTGGLYQIPGYIFFSISIICFILSAIFFLWDIVLSLKAIKLEVKEFIHIEER